MEKIKVGQILYREETDHRGKTTGEITPVEVAKVGNKYFYLRSYNGTISNGKYDIDTMKYVTEYTSQQVRLYFTEQEIIDKNKKQKYLSTLREVFLWYGPCSRLSLDKIERIIQIINE